MIPSIGTGEVKSVHVAPELHAVGVGLSWQNWWQTLLPGQFKPAAQSASTVHRDPTVPDPGGTQSAPFVIFLTQASPAGHVFGSSVHGLQLP